MNLLSEMARAAWQAREDRFPARVRIKFEERFIEDDAQVVLMLRAALSAALKHGWKLVPVEPTFEMWDSAENESMTAEMALEANDEAVRKDAFNFPTRRIWNGVVMYRAMIEAAPSIEGDG